MFAAARSSASRSSGGIRSAASARTPASSSSVSAETPSKRSPSSLNAWSPPSRTAAIVLRDGGHDPLRLRHGRAQLARQACRFVPVPAAGRDPHGRGVAEPLDHRVELVDAKLVSDPVGDQASRADADLLDHLEPVVGEGPAGVDEVDDPVRQPDERGELDGALDLDHLGLPAHALEVALGGVRVLGRDSDRAEAALGGTELVGPGLPGDDHPAATEAEVGELVDGPIRLLDQHVLAGDPEVRGSRLDVRRHIGRPHGDDRQLPEVEDQRA